MKAVAGLPPFPPVLDRLLATLSNESVSVSRISDLIERDTVIAGNVLKLVNSALYGRRGTVNSIRHAVSLLGITKVRNAVFAMSLTRVWSKVRTAPGWSMARFNLHSVACGLLCDCLAQRVSVEYPEGAFAAGLFHDLGELLISIALHQELRDPEVIGISHPEFSAEALAIWDLPPAIQRAVRFHHTPEEDHLNVAPARYRLALIVQCADNYLEQAGMGLTDANEAPEQPADAFAPLGLDTAAADFIGQFQTEMNVLTNAFH